jgi:hypothetical protein
LFGPDLVGEPEKKIKTGIIQKSKICFTGLERDIKIACFSVTILASEGLILS